MTERELSTRIDQWLEGQGYPLEFVTSAAFAKAGFRIWQGHYVEDTKAPREIDVVAVHDNNRNGTLVRVQFVVECKWTADKPWVLFTSHHSRIAPSACIAQTLGSKAGQMVLWAHAGDAAFQKLGIFEVPSEPGFGGRQAFSDNRDVVFETLSSISSLAHTTANRYDRYVADPREHLDLAVVVLPVIVLKGRLFTASFDESSGKLTTKEVASARLHWRGSDKWRLNTTIDVVTEAELSAYALKKKNDADQLARSMSESIDKVRAALAEGDITKWPITAGGRGVVGRPRLLRELAKEIKGANEESEGAA